MRVALLFLLLAGCGAAGRDVSNERVLTHEEANRLVAFARDFRACMDAGGVHLGAVHPNRTRITLAGDAQPRDVVRCGDRLGGPPPGASLQIRPREHLVALYLPKRCLLPTNV